MHEILILLHTTPFNNRVTENLLNIFQSEMKSTFTWAMPRKSIRAAVFVFFDNILRKIDLHHIPVCSIIYYCEEVLHTTLFNNREHHTIYKNLSVTGNWAVCGCVRVCDTSLDSPWHPHERMPGAALRRPRAPAIGKNVFFTS